MLEQEIPAIHLAEAKVVFPELKVPGYNSGSGSDSGSESDSDSESDSGSVWSRRSSLDSLPESVGRGRTVRGPWDHAGTIKIPFDVASVLQPPRRAAVNVLQKV